MSKAFRDLVFKVSRVLKAEVFRDLKVREFKEVRGYRVIKA